MGIYEKPSEAFLDALDREFELHRAARARLRHGRGDPRDARRQGARASWAWAATSSRATPDTARHRGGAAPRRPHRAGVDEAQPLARRHRSSRDHPADARPHRPRPPRRRRAAGHRRGLDGRRARLARPPRAAVRGPAERGRDRRAAVRAAVRDGCRRPARPARSTSTRAVEVDCGQAERDGQLERTAVRRASARRRSSAAAAARHPLTFPQADWAALEHDYALIRAAHRARRSRASRTSRRRSTRARTLFLPNGPRDERRFATVDGKARFTVNPLEYPRIPRGRLLLQTLRSHDQYNTTIYGKDDRYRGIHGGRRVVLVNPKDIQALGFAEGEIVDLVSEWAGRRRRDPGAARRGVPDRRLLARRGATPPPTTPRRTCSCRSTRSPTSAGRRPRSRSSCGSSAASA